MIEGIHTSLVTPFTPDRLAVDEATLRRSVRYQIAAGAGGVCALGGTGEPLSMTTDEHRTVVDAVVSEVAGRVPITIGCLLGGQADIIAVARYARAAGADHIMVVPPYFFSVRPFDIRRHLETIAEACDLPIVFFHSPGRTGVRLSRGRAPGAVPHRAVDQGRQGRLRRRGARRRSHPRSAGGVLVPAGARRAPAADARARRDGRHRIARRASPVGPRHALPVGRPGGYRDGRDACSSPSCRSVDGSTRSRIRGLSSSPWSSPDGRRDRAEARFTARGTTRGAALLELVPPLVRSEA